MREAIEWIRRHVELRRSGSVESLYDHMESQSGEQLPVVYVPFEGAKRGHFADRGAILDYVTVCGRGRVLDFGPGDGWPSLLMAPMVQEVVGVDGSRRRVEVCAKNAARLGLTNASFVHVPPGEPLPFADESFDGIAAASSVEQTPDPRGTLRELFRVLKPGGRLRMHYESLSYYAGGRELEMKIGADRGAADLLVFEREVAREYVNHYLLVFDLPPEAVREDLAARPESPAEVLGDLRRHLTEAATWRTRHPSCRGWLRWLREAGFSSAEATYDGGWFAERLFDRLPEDRRPREMAVVDEMLRPLVEVAVEMTAPSAAPPGEWEPWITAVR